MTLADKPVAPAMDILAALETAPSRGGKRCALAEFLDSIPEDQPGRGELIRLVETRHERNSSDTRSSQNMAMVLTNLGYATTSNPVLDHRQHACRCYR